VLSNLSGLTPNKNPAVININGLEAIMNLSLSTNVLGFLNFTFQDATGKNLVSHVSGDVPGVARVKGNAGLTLHVSELFNVTVSENWVGQRQSPRTDPYGPVKGYALTNCAVSTTKLFNNRISAAFEVHNLFNTKWLDPGFRTADGLLYSTVLEQPGINGLFKVGVSF